MLRRVLRIRGRYRIGSDRIGSHRAAVQVVVLTYSFKRGQIIRFARHRPRSRLKYSDVGWRGKGQNKCYGITMDSVCSLTLYHHGVVVVPPPSPLRSLLLPPLPPPSHPFSPHPLPSSSPPPSPYLSETFTAASSTVGVHVCVNIVRVFTSGCEYACVCVCMYVRICTTAATFLSTWEKEEGRKEKRKEEGKEKKRRSQSGRGEYQWRRNTRRKK